MYRIWTCLQDELQDWKSQACTEEQSKARLYDPEEAFLILPTATSSSGG